MVGRSATLAPAMGASHDDSRRPQHREEVISTTPWGFPHELEMAGGWATLTGKTRVVRSTQITGGAPLLALFVMLLRAVRQVASPCLVRSQNGEQFSLVIFR